MVQMVKDRIVLGMFERYNPFSGSLGKNVTKEILRCLQWFGNEWLKNRAELIKWERGSNSRLGLVHSMFKILFNSRVEMVNS